MPNIEFDDFYGVQAFIRDRAPKLTAMGVKVFVDWHHNKVVLTPPPGVELCVDCNQEFAMEGSSACEGCYDKLMNEPQEHKKPEYAMEFYTCNLCGKRNQFHVRLPSKTSISGPRTCSSCGAQERDLTFDKVYTADEYGAITE